MTYQKLQNITLPEILKLEKRYRINFINSITGYKAASLIATTNENGAENIAIFSSMVHIGANPPLIGFVMRPLTIPRQTYSNIKKTGFYTLNQVHTDIVWQAHQTSAKYAEEVSEFSATDLTPWYSDNFPAPYLAESHVKMGLKFVEEQHIRVNGTILIIGEIQELFYPENIISKDGSADLNAIETVAITGLDTYHLPQKLKRFSYARPHEPSIEI